MNGARKRGAALLSAFLTLALALVAVLTPTPALAAAVTDGTLTVSGPSTEPGTGGVNLKDGDKVTLYQIVKGDLADGTITYTFNGDYGVEASSYFGSETVSSADAQAIAKAVLVDGKTAPTTGPVDVTNGTATFFNLEAGEYLVVVTAGGTNDARVFQNVIVKVAPEPTQNTTTGVWSYPATFTGATAIKAEEPGITKKVNDQDQIDTVNNSKTATYVITSAIPAYPATATDRYFKLTDVADEGISYAANDVTVKVNNADVTSATGVSVSKSGQTLTVQFDNAFVVAHPSMSVEVSYEATVTGQTHTQPKENTATVEWPTHTTGSDKGNKDDDAKIYSYEVEVTKTGENGVGLAGAKFHVEDSSNAIMTLKDSTGASVTQFTSGSDGKFLIDGLAVGTYYLVEDEAPAGYVKSTEKITFTVTSAIPTEGAATTLQAGPTITNTKQPALPQTGGAGTIALTAVGVLLMAGAGAFVMRLRRDED